MIEVPARPFSAGFWRLPAPRCLAFVMGATSVTLIGLPDIVLWILLVPGTVPVIGATLWTAGRAWHVERLLEQGLDTDQPDFRLGAYLGKK
jgi:hypothetical protein